VPDLTQILSSNIYFSAATLEILNDNDSIVAASTVNLGPPESYHIHNVTDISQNTSPGCAYFEQAPPIEANDQIIYAATSIVNSWPVNIDNQGYLEMDVGFSGKTDTINYYHYSANTESWSEEWIQEISTEAVLSNSKTQ
jgi:hypothetical protein